MNHYLSLLGVVAAMCATSTVSAADWFVKVDAESGNDGTSWETAFNLADAIKKINSSDVVTGDNVYFAGGEYTYPSGNTTGVKMQNKLVNLHGGYATNLTGTEHPTLSYPTETPTILNGDGSVRNLIFVQTTKASGLLSEEDRAVLIEGFTLKGANYTGSKGTELGAINCDMTRTVTIRNCTFTGNTCTNAGAAFSNSGSRTHFIDCVFEGNQGKDAGIAINQSKRGDADSYFKPVAVVERSLITGNATTGTTSSCAGGSAIRVNAGSVYILNSTITDNTGYHKGAIHMNSGTSLYVFSSTIANNHETSETSGTTYGNGIYGTDTPAIELINSYVVGDVDDTAVEVPSIVVDAMTKNVADVLTSYGCNILGALSFTDSSSASCDFTAVLEDGYDTYNNSAADLFGTCSLNDKGGYSKVLVPKELCRKVTTADLESQITFPFTVTKSVDQRNVKRPDSASIGAFDDNTSGVEDVTGDKVGLKVSNIGDGIYVMSIEADNVAVYGISGCVVARAQKTKVIDLSSVAKGVYIVVADSKVAKIIR